MFIPHDFIALVPLALIAFCHRQIAKNGAFILVLTNLPMTILHELAHYAAALLLGGKPVGFSLWPKREYGTWRLGSVTAQVTLLSAAPTALAPLTWLIAGGALLTERVALAGESVPLSCGIYLAAYMCISASIPSLQDLTVAIMHPLSLILWSAILIAVYYALG